MPLIEAQQSSSLIGAQFTEFVINTTQIIHMTSHFAVVLNNQSFKTAVNPFITFIASCSLLYYVVKWGIFSSRSPSVKLRTQVGDTIRHQCKFRRI